MTSYFSKNKNPRTKNGILPGSTIIKFQIILFITLTMFLTSCQEKDTTIGIGLLPGSDFVDIFSTDTIKPFSYTCYVDSVVTNKKAYVMLGGVQDPYFGYTSADMIAQMRLVQAWPGKGGFTVDSVKLFFSITGAKGELGTALKIKLSEVGEILKPIITAYPDSIKYYSSHRPVIVKELGMFDMPLITKDTAQNVTVKLPIELGQYLMRDTTKLYQGDINTDFRSFFRGIKASLVKNSPVETKGITDSDAPLLLILPINGFNFEIRVYYKNSTADDNVFDFAVNTRSARYTTYTHDFTLADPDKKIQHINDGFQDTVTYMQGLNGAFTRLRFPSLESIRNMMPISVNRARITIPVILDNDKYISDAMPKKMYLSFTKSSGEKAIISDYYVGSSFLDGSFNTTSKTYSFNIASFVQQYIEGKIDEPELDLYLDDGDYRNAILRTKQSTNPAKFVFTYTEF
ncbi:MAG: DUF4270 family protein [Bacteroidales bacterium]